MSTFNIIDITPAGAYMNATQAAHGSDRRNAERYVETGESRNALNGLRTLVRRIAAITEKRPASSQPASRPA